jgi:hypothetical protein
MLSAMAKGNAGAMQTAAVLREKKRDAEHSKELQAAQERLEAFQDETGARIAALEKSLATATSERSHAQYVPCMRCECVFLCTSHSCVCITVYHSIRVCCMCVYVCSYVQECVCVSICVPSFSYPTKGSSDSACARRRCHPE